MSDSTAVATQKPISAKSPDVQARIQEARERNAIVKAIRGTMWGKDLGQIVQGAIAEYCRVNQIDAVRHVEVLGGKLYLVAEFYDERGAYLIRDGVIIPDEPDFIHVDPRLEKLAAEGDEWAKAEVQRRLRMRIQHAAPEEAKAICVWTFRVRESGALVTGVNWCGGGTRKKIGKGGQVYDADPIGDLEPTKTAETRARRRAWRKIADVIPAYGQIVRPIEESARTAVPVAIIDPTETEQRAKGLGAAGSDPYQLSAGEPATKQAETEEDLAAEQREFVENDRTREAGEEG